MTVFVDIPTTGAAAESYLIYTNRSRGDSLAGSFSRIKRNLVEGEAVANLNALLLQTKLNLETSSVNQAGPRPQSGKQRFVDWLLGRAGLLWLLMAIVVFVALFGLRKRYSQRSAASFERDH